MRKRLTLLAILLIPVFLFSQEKKTKSHGTASKGNIPVQAKYSNKFAIKNVDFNRRIDLAGRGEILETTFILDNLTNDPMDFYIFVIGTFEKVEKTKSSFEMPIPEKERIRNFIPFPGDIKNFQYPAKDSKGNAIKDESGKDKIILIKHPHDPKIGVNPRTGKLYHLEQQLAVRTQILSKYRKHYVYFNEVAILIFDKDAKLVFRQLFELKGYRR